MNVIPSVAYLREKAGGLSGCGCGQGTAVEGWGKMDCPRCAEIMIVYLRAIWPDVGMPLPDQKIPTPTFK